MKNSIKGKIALGLIFSVAVAGFALQHKAEKFVVKNANDILSSINNTSTSDPKPSK